MNSLELPLADTADALQPAAPRARRSLPTRWISVLTVATLLASWWLVTAAGWVEPLFLPSPGDVVAKAGQLLSQGYMEASLWQHLGASLGRIGLALLLATLSAIPIGIAIGYNRVARGIFDPLIEFYRPIPPLAYLPLIVIWLGIDESAKVTLIHLACFAPLAMASKAGVRSVAIEQINAARSLGASNWQVIRMVVFPAALPEILTGMRIAVGFGWTTLVAAEMVAATAGIGQMVLNASNFLRTDIVIMGIIVIGVLAYLIDLLMRKMEEKLIPWKGKM